MLQRCFIGWACLGLLICVGCSFGPSRVEGPEFDAESSARQAMELYDSNSDGQLDEQELEACAALAKAVAEVDKDGDGLLSEDEIKARVEYFVQSRLGRMQLACRVVRGGRTIPGATVTFVPEPFMGDILETARGKTNEVGMATIHIEDQLGGIQPGFYRVEISRPNASGKEMLPKKFNTETILGQEVTSGSVALSTGLVFELK